MNTLSKLAVAILSGDVSADDARAAIDAAERVRGYLCGESIRVVSPAVAPPEGKIGLVWFRPVERTSVHLCKPPRLSVDAAAISRKIGVDGTEAECVRQMQEKAEAWGYFVPPYPFDLPAELTDNEEAIVNIWRAFLDLSNRRQVGLHLTFDAEGFACVTNNYTNAVALPWTAPDKAAERIRNLPS